MGYSILKYGCPMVNEIDDLEEAKKEAVRFVTRITGSEYIEIRDSKDETVTIGYFDGGRFHWSRDRRQAESLKGLSFVTKPPLRRGCSKLEGKEGI